MKHMVLDKQFLISSP